LLQIAERIPTIATQLKIVRNQFK